MVEVREYLVVVTGNVQKSGGDRSCAGCDIGYGGKQSTCSISLISIVIVIIDRNARFGNGAEFQTRRQVILGRELALLSSSDYIEPLTEDVPRLVKADELSREATSPTVAEAHNTL